MTEVYQSLASSIYLNLLITGKNQLLTALPCWNGLTHSSSRISPFSPPARTCLFYLKTLSSIFQIESGTHLLSHAVSSIVPSAAYVLTVVFGMGTGVSHKRIGTGIFHFQFRLPSSANHLTELRSLSRFAQSANTICQLLKSEKVNFFIFSSLPSRAGSLKSSTVYKTLTSSSLERR